LRPRIACGRFEEERYSFPLFFAVDYDTKVQPLDRFVTEERPAKEGLTAGELCLRRLPRASTI
jgi:isopenicillin N synthase-like dioxygenase